MRSLGNGAQSAISEGGLEEPRAGPGTIHRVSGPEWGVMRAIYRGVYVLFGKGSEKGVG